MNVHQPLSRVAPPASPADMIDDRPSDKVFRVRKSIYVDPECRGRCVGKLLLEQLIDRARALGFAAIIAVIDGAGGKLNDFLAGDGLWKGNRVIAGSAEIYPALEGLFGEGTS